MAKYQLHLKGYVGGADFNSRAVDRCLADNAGRDVAVLIDSTGGALGTGLSVASAFRRHGAVDVHFAGLNASAATVAALGARTVTMDRGAMYLVHKCSNLVFAWQSMNADELEDYIADLEKNRADLAKLDDNIAAMYAARCRKDRKELLALMERGAWLNAQEALEWGFIDKITDREEDEAPRVTASLAADFKAAGLPLPCEPEKKRGPIASLLSAARSFLSGAPGENDGGEAPLPSEQSDQTESAASAPEAIEGCAASAPGPETVTVIETGSERKEDKADDSLAGFMAAQRSARELYDMLP